MSHAPLKKGERGTRARARKEFGGVFPGMLEKRLGRP
jgi:hypothetical protein